MTNEEAKSGDLISRREVLDAIVRIRLGHTDVVKVSTLIMDYVKRIPSVNPQEPKIGHWINKDGQVSAECSCCNRNNTLYGDFCKWCGAKMIEAKGNEENMRDFTPEESELYQKSLDKIYRPIGMNVFDKENEK